MKRCNCRFVDKEFELKQMNVYMTKLKCLFTGKIDIEQE